jgi:catechol 2,3-dioxygenase-like lactoylglutathione lyase family enzyme
VDHGGVIDHLSIQCADVAASGDFYDAVLAPLGFGRVLDFGDVIGFGRPPVPAFWIGPKTPGAGSLETHIAFSSPDRQTVRAFATAAEAIGAVLLHAPRLWPEYDEHYYGAFVRDPDGNNVEAVCRTPE